MSPEQKKNLADYYRSCEADKLVLNITDRELTKCEQREFRIHWTESVIGFFIGLATMGALK